MPVSFEWGTKVTLFNDAWATETSFEYVMALVGRGLHSSTFRLNKSAFCGRGMLLGDV